MKMQHNCQGIFQWKTTKGHRKWVKVKIWKISRVAFVLRSFLFHIYINDIPDAVAGLIKLFADDANCIPQLKIIKNS